MGSAKGVSRVGGFAVAVGLGMAVATTPGVALAEPSEPGSASPESSASSPSSNESASSTTDSTTDGADKSSTADDDAAETPQDETSSSTEQESAADDEPDVASEPVDEVESVDEPESVEVAEPIDEAESVEVAEPVPSEPEPTEDTEAAEPQPTNNTEAAESQLVSVPEPERFYEHNTSAAQRASAAAVADPSTSASAQTTVSAPAEESAAAPTATAAVESTAPSSTESAVIADTSLQTTVVETQAVPSPLSAPVSPVSAVSNVVSGLLAWVGLALSAANTPIAPGQSPGLLMALVAVRRELQQTLAQQSPTVGYAAAQTSQSEPGLLGGLLGLGNQPPTVNYDPADNVQDAEGVVTGNINSVDVEGDTLNYTVTQAPQHGSVVVNADGSFRYTPDADFAQTGGADTFTVRVADGAGLLVSVLRILNPDFHTATAAVGLTVQPVNEPPEVGDPAHAVVDVNPNTGVVTGTVNVTDPDGDTLSYSVSGVDPAKGTVTVDAATGNWTYTPTLNARLRATDINATPDDQQIVFTVTANDGQVGTPVTVTAPLQTMAISTINVGDAPEQLVVSPDGTRIYLTHNSVDDLEADIVSVIDPATNTVIATIPIGPAPSGVAISPDGTRVYVPILLHGVEVIDTATNAVITSIPVGDTEDLQAVAVSPDGLVAYVPIYGNGFDPDQLVSIDTATNTVIGSFPVGIGRPTDVAVGPDGTVYVVNDGAVFVIANGTVPPAPTIPIHPNGGESVTDVAVSPDGTRVYVTSFDGVVSVIDTDPGSATYNTVIDTIATGSGVTGDLVVSPGGEYAFLTRPEALGDTDDTLQVIDLATNTLVATIPMGASPFGAAVSPDGNHLYVANIDDDTVSVITLG